MADEWTRAMVADRLDLAADVMRSMPPVRRRAMSAPGRNMSRPSPIKLGRSRG